MAIIDKPSDYFNTKLFTGNGGTNAISGIGFQPDWIWFKNRTSAQSHAIVDSVRGRKGLQSNAADAEYTLASGKDFGTFDSDGFTVLTPQQLNSFNYNTGSIVSWNWKAGTSFTNDASSTGIGTIDSAGSANDTAGFSIVTYTGNGSSGATVKHGMNQKPSMFIIKDRDNSNEGWMVYHTSLGATKYMRLNETGAAATGSAYFNDTEPTSSVFTIGNNDVVNKSGDKYVTYCFASKQGYSKFGSYTGNGNANGSFIYTGFKPAWFMFKRTNGSGRWQILDNKRNLSNVTDKGISANTNGAEGSGWSLDFLSNGVKLRYNDTEINGSGDSFIYMAWAENPFVASNFVPTTAK